MALMERDIAIDMGSMNTRIYVSGRGITLREPTLVAVNRDSGKLLKTGEEAKKILGRTPSDIVSIHPISAGVISDYDMTCALLKVFLGRVTTLSLLKPKVMIAVPASISGVEERAMIDAAIEAGARRVYLLESSLASAVGAGVDINKPNGRMIVDIGGGTTEIAVVSLGGVVVSESIKTAGVMFDDAIVRYVRRKHNLLIGRRTAEEIKQSIGCVFPKDNVSYQEISGRCLLTGLARSVTMSSSDIMEALEETVGEIMDAILAVLEKTPPELVSDISKNGIILCGGSSQLWGMDKLVSSVTKIETILVDDPSSCTAFGTGRMLQNIYQMNEGMINLARRKGMNLA